MSFDFFVSTLEQMPSVRRISLFNWGEPFLNPHLLEMIRFATARNVFVQIHSNLCFGTTDAFVEEIVSSGLQLLSISIDGASEGTYQAYRIGGNFSLVIANVARLIAARTRLNSETPTIVWKFTVNRFNELEIDVARKMATALGAQFVLSKIQCEDLPDVSFHGTHDQRINTWVSANPQYVHTPNYAKTCDRLFISPVIAPDGKVFPCCYVADQDSAFGDLRTESFSDIWNNEKYRFARSIFSGRRYVGEPPLIPCTNCNRFPNSHIRPK